MDWPRDSAFAYPPHTVAALRTWLFAASENLERAIRASMEVQGRQKNDAARANVIRVEHVLRAREEHLPE